MKPAHVAIIMDGNGRWAKARGLPRLAGHHAGVEALREVVRAAPAQGIEWLTVYAFSSENWSRPAAEVSDLMGLLKLFIKRDLAELNKAGVCVRMIGAKDNLKPDIRILVDEAEALTRDNSKLKLIIAFNYGARDEMVRAVRRIAEDVAAGRTSVQAIDENMVSHALDTAGIPDPDLVIRTSGEQRLSNFLLWQSAYSEFVFAPCMWPDFGADELRAAIDTYSRRDRRYGRVAEADLAS